MKNLKSRIALRSLIRRVLAITLKMDKYEELSLFLCIFLTRTHDSQNAKESKNLLKTQDINSQNAEELKNPLKSIIKYLLQNGDDNPDCLVEETINGIQKDIKENAEGEKTIKGGIYLGWENDNVKLIKQYKLEKPNDLHRLFNDTNEHLGPTYGNNYDFLLTGYVFLISALICDSDDVKRVGQRILSTVVEGATEAAEGATEEIRITRVNLPIKSINKPAIWLLGPTYSNKNSKPPCYLVLYLKEYENDTIQYFYNIIPDIFMSRFKIDDIRKEFKKFEDKIKNVTNEYKNVEKVDYIHKVLKEFEEEIKNVTAKYRKEAKKVYYIHKVFKGFKEKTKSNAIDEDRRKDEKIDYIYKAFKEFEEKIKNNAIDEDRKKDEKIDYIRKVFKEFEEEIKNNVIDEGRKKDEKAFKEFEKEIENVTAKYREKAEKVEDIKRYEKVIKREDYINQNIGIIEEELKVLSEYYTEHNKITKAMFQLTHSAEVNFDNIKRILSAFGLPKELLFMDCFYEAEKNLKEMQFYSNFYYQEGSKIADDIMSIEIQSNILRGKLESIENRQNELRNIILAAAGIIISFLQIFSEEARFAILHALNIISNEIKNILNNLL